LTSSGGELHGSWSATNAILTSDRRLKDKIIPLHETLLNPGAAQDELPRAGATETKDSALWLLRQMRPVSYHFRKGPESKFMRFGFIADEMEKIVPSVVRTTPSAELKDKKGIVYADLIALLAAATQSQQRSIERLEKSVAELAEEVKRMMREMAV